MKKQRIYFIGFMGAGKTTIGKLLAEAGRCPWVDTDQKIEEQEGFSVQDIFANKGEDYFRETEKQVLKEVSEPEKVIISCGGGMILQPENLSYMKEHGVIVYLSANTSTLAERLKSQTDRPLLQQGEGTLEERIEALLARRRNVYETAADIIFETDGKNPELIVEELKKQFLQ